MTNGSLARLARIGKGWTLEVLADMSSLSISYLSKVENDERDVPDVIKKLLELDAGPQWYFDIVEAVEKIYVENRASSVISSFHNAIALKSWLF